MPHPLRKSLPWVGAAAAAILVTGMLPANIAAAAPSGYSFQESGFILRLRASAIQAQADIPHPLLVGINTAAVNLEKEIGGPYAKCEIRAAGEYPGEIVQEGVLENSGPPDAGNKGGGIINPTESKDFQPNLSPGENLSAREPRLRNMTDGSAILDVPHGGNGPRWQAKCNEDAGGTAIADFEGGGAEAAGGSVVSNIDKKTGEYIGTGRTYILGLKTASGTIDSLTSVMQIKSLPGKESLVSYRIAATGGTLASGLDVPASDLTKQFNESVKQNANALKAIGPMGLTLLGPTTSFSENGHRPIINAPFFQLTAGLEARKGTAGENDHLRLLNVDFEGQYDQ